MKSTKSTYKHEYIGSSGSISLFRTDNIIWLHNADTDVVMHVPIAGPISNLVKHAYEFQRSHFQASGEYDRDNGCEVLPCLLVMLESTGASWRPVSHPKTWLMTYLGTLVCQKAETGHIWDSFEDYVAGFEFYRDYMLKSGFKLSPFDAFPSESDLRTHYLKWAPQLRRH